MIWVRLVIIASLNVISNLNYYSTQDQNVDYNIIPNFDNEKTSNTTAQAKSLIDSKAKCAGFNDMLFCLKSKVARY